MSDEKKLFVGDKEISLEEMSKSIVQGLMKAINDDGDWKRYLLRLEFFAKRGGHEVSITGLVLSPLDEKPKTEAERRANPDKFMKELKKI